MKRIIGMPGDVLEIRQGKVYVNGSVEPLDDSFVDYPTFDNWGPRKIPDSHYFMMGDNRADSLDSRAWNNTYVHRSNILGEVIFSYYPRFQFIQ